MSTHQSTRYLLSAAAVSDLIESQIGTLSCTFTPSSEIARYTVLDQFDQPLRQRGQLLFCSGKTLELIDETGQHWSQPLVNQADFFAHIPNGPLKRALTRLSPLRRLLPTGAGNWQQARLTLTDDQDKTHCRLHLLLFTAAPGHAVAIATLRGLKGYDDSLTLLQQRLLELGCTLFNSEALYDALFPVQSAPQGKAQVSVASDASAIQAANHIIASQLQAARAKESGIIADHDTEFLHDYRVQLRKIRSVLSLFKGVYDEALNSDLKAQFSAIMAPTGKLRDLDVYLLDKARYYDLLPKSLHAGLDILYGMFARNRDVEQGHLATYLQSKAYREQISHVSALFAAPERLTAGPSATLSVRQYACDLIWARYRKVCRIAAKIDASTPDEQVHQLRIECKKLRYLMEFFSTMFSEALFKNVLKPLKQLQDNLGLFNDYSVQQVNLSQAMQSLSATDSPPDVEVAQSVGALIAVLHGRQLEERAKVTQNLIQFDSPQTREAYRLLFQPQQDAV